jgi:hypothetical protein
VHYNYGKVTREQSIRFDMHNQGMDPRHFGTLPFEFVSRRLKMEFIYFVVLWLNAFPAKSGVSATYSPWELLVCWKLDYKKQSWVLPSTYCKDRHRVQLVRRVAQEPLVRGSNPSGARVQGIEGLRVAEPLVRGSNP